MAMLLKERALPTIKVVDGVKYYMAEIREPWDQDGYLIFQLLLTEKEMLGMVAEWTSSLSRSQP